MAVGFPAKTTYVDGDVFSASDINDTNGTINLLQTSTLSQSAGKNAVINGGMDIWQRGTSFANAASRIYTADRFMAYRFGFQNNITTSRVASGLTGFTYAMRNQRTAADIQTGAFFIDHALESIDSLRFAGQTVTFSFYARAGANYSPTSSFLNLLLRSGTGTDQIFTSMSGASTVVSGNATLTTSWQRFTFTGSVPSASTQLGFEFTATPTGVAGANDWFDITGVQLELGSYATSFLRTGGTIQGELAAAQRYYYRQVANSGARFGDGHNNATTSAEFITFFPVQMRVAPTALETTGTASDYSVRSANANTTTSGVPTFNQSTTLIGQFIFVVASGLTLGLGAFARSNATGAFLGWSAEL
jgi:hypothetical protein